MATKGRCGRQPQVTHTVMLPPLAPYIAASNRCADQVSFRTSTLLVAKGHANIFCTDMHCQLLRSSHQAVGRGSVFQKGWDRRAIDASILNAPLCRAILCQRLSFQHYGNLLGTSAANPAPAKPEAYSGMLATDWNVVALDCVAAIICPAVNFGSALTKL